MRGVMEFRIDHPIGNLLGWWELAGADTLVSDENVGWLKLPEMARLRADAKEISREISPAAGEMPSNLAEFLNWLETSPDVPEAARSEEHTSELQSLIRISYAVFCLQKKNQPTTEREKVTTHLNKSDYTTT